MCSKTELISALACMQNLCVCDCVILSQPDGSLSAYFMHMWILNRGFSSQSVGSASLLRNIDSEILRMVVEMVREKTGVKSWRFLQVYARHVNVSNVFLIFVFCVSVSSLSHSKLSYFRAAMNTPL